MEQPWDLSRDSASSQPLKLPSISCLASGVPVSGHPAPDDSPAYSDLNSRDSGNWSASSVQSPSKHSSIASSVLTGITLPPLGGSRTSPNRISGAGSDRLAISSAFTNGSIPTSTAQPATATFMPSHQPSNLSQINQPYDGGLQRPPQRASADFPTSDSRRESVDSRMNTRMNELNLTSSPFTSNNVSQTSLVSGLQRERGIIGGDGSQRPNGYFFGPRFGAHTSQSPLGPNVGGDSQTRRTTVQPRQAPPIAGPNRIGPNPNAPNPTKGYAWAFPTGEEEEEEKAVSHHLSRKGSTAGTSITSSIFTNDSRLPAGQRRLDEIASGSDDLPDLSHSRSATDLSLPGHPSLHHHHLQNRHLNRLSDEPDSPNGATPYSRTPELRVSHKLAERKRRGEMKDLFEELRQRLPQERASKPSKWEVLTKAIDYIKALENHVNKEIATTQTKTYENNTLAKQNLELARENERLRQQLHQGQPSQQSMQHIYNNYPQALPVTNRPPSQNQEQAVPGVPIPNGIAPTSMQGIEYAVR
ncbi:MAG: hypothetical protein M1829_002388 [Trizodia sp. TS-e1964]|nr:MAG: hypothetical protein M1829_002388 [Trizodia sp. TS-e1964]